MLNVKLKKVTDVTNIFTIKDTKKLNVLKILNNVLKTLNENNF